MVSSNVIRGGGLLLLVATGVTLQRVYTINVVEKASTLNNELIGAGRGSQYNTCSGDSKTLKKLTSVNLVDKPATDLKYNFYSIQNPKDYLGGGDAVVVETGPYNLRKYTVAYDVAQTTSSLTASSSPDAKGAFEYSTANAYLVLDKDIKATMNMQRNADFSLTVAESKATLSAKQALASHLSMTDVVVNYSPEYLSFLGAMNDEVNMILSLTCTANQIANIGITDKSQCTTNELGDVAATNCACCMMDDAFALATSRNAGTPPAFTNCNTYFNDEDYALSKLSLLASYDGGVIAKAAGEKKYDGSGTDFTATAYGQKNIHTALIQSHTINDLMFGYPSAYLGWVGFRAQIAQAAKALDTSLSTTELAKRMLTGGFDANLSFKLGNVADYTSKVGSVCYATCLKTGNCEGNAPGRQETSDVDKVKLGGIECKPYTPAYEAIAKCKAASAALLLNPSAAGMEACVCANDSDEWNSKGCCLAAGKHSGSNLRGEGCLFEVAGVVDPNYAGIDTTIANAVDLGTALRSWISKEESKTASNFMCPAIGSALDEHKKLGYYESYDGSKEHATYYSTGYARMRQDDVINPTSNASISAVTGGSGKYFVPKGLTTKVGTSQFSDGIPANATHIVYVPDAKKAISFAFEGIRPNGVRNQICGSGTCIVSARLRPAASTFDFNSAVASDGTGLPFNGLKQVGHLSGSSKTGRPEYIHHPLYYWGASALYTQQNNSYAERPDGNGIKIYRPLTNSAPGAFDASRSNYQLVDKTYVDSQKDALLSHIDIEVGTGLGARQRMRFGKSYSIWECDPFINAKCQRAVKSKGSASCYGTAGAAAFDALATADRTDLGVLGRNNMTFPCSAANLLTPHVVGGKILPMYWYEESTIHATADEINFLAAYATSYRDAGLTFVTIISLSVITGLIGMSALLLCLFFEQKYDFMNAQKENSMPTTQAPTTTTTKNSAA